MTETGAQRFTGKVSFVTGAGSGIGRETALALAVEGAAVAVAGIPESDIRETVRLIEQSGGRALALTCDVTSDSDVKNVLDRTIETFSGWTLHLTTPGWSSRKPGSRTSPPSSGTASSTSTSPRRSYACGTRSR